jgi:hypothetical protein
LLILPFRALGKNTQIAFVEIHQNTFLGKVLKRLLYIAEEALRIEANEEHQE